MQRNEPLKIAHIAVAVKSLAETMPALEKVLGLKSSSVEEVPTEKVRVQFVEMGGIRFEFLEPTADDSPIAKFLEKRGSGMHHVAFEVSDIRSRLKAMKDKQVPLIHETPKLGAEGCEVAFLHPKAVPGLLIEFVQGVHS